MKKGKIVLAGLALIASIGGAFAFKAQQKFVTEYQAYDINKNILDGCYYPTATPNCGTNLSAGTQFYYYDGSQFVLRTAPAGGQTFYAQ